VLQRISVSKTKEVTGGWGEMHNEELHNLYSLLNVIKSQDSSVGVVTGCGLDDWGLIPIGGLGIFLFNTMSRPAVGLTPPPIQWVPGVLSLGIKQLNHAEVKECIEFYSTLQYIFMVWCLVKHWDNFTFTFTECY
jgi:hypothetical protein